MDRFFAIFGSLPCVYDGLKGQGQILGAAGSKGAGGQGGVAAGPLTTQTFANGPPHLV